MTRRISELEEYYKDPNQVLLETRALTNTDNKEVGFSKEEVKDLKEKIVLTGLRKDIVLNIIALEIQTARLFNESIIHPETKEIMEKVAYGLEYGLPVEKELLFKIAPDAFGTEIRHLKFEEQRKYLQPRVNLGYIDKPELNDVRNHLSEREESSQKLLDDKISSMRLYHLDQCSDFMRYYMPYIKERVQQFEYKNEKEYLEDLLIIDEDKLAEVEKRMVKEIRALQRIHEDIHALYLRSFDIFPEDLNKPPFPMLDTKFQEKLIKRIKYQYKYEVVDLKDVSCYKDLDWLNT